MKLFKLRKLVATKTTRRPLYRKICPGRSVNAARQLFPYNIILLLRGGYSPGTRDLVRSAAPDTSLSARLVTLLPENSY